MTERQTVFAAIAVAVFAAWSIDVPWWCVAAVAVAVVVTRHPIAIIVLLCVGSGALASRAEAGLWTSTKSVTGVATVVADPEARPGGLVVEWRFEGRRYRSFVGSEQAAGLQGAMVGEKYAVVGRTGSLSGPWEWRASRHLSGRLTVDSARRVSEGDWWWQSANWLHRSVEAGLESFSPEARALFLGVVLGDDRGQSDLDVFRFRASGLAHITAVSGQNVAFVLVAASPVLRLLRLRWRWVVTVGLLCWFAVVTRLEPSVLRAVAMAIVAATVSWWGRFASGLRVVSVAVIALLLVDPLLVWSLGFRLSVSASVALVLLARPLARVLPGPRLLAEGIAVSLAAQVGTAPLLLGLAGSVPALGPMVNLIAVPVAGWLMICGIVAGPVAGMGGAPLATALGWPSRLMVWWLSTVARWFSSPMLPRLGPVGVAGSSIAVIVLVAGALRSESGRARWPRVLVVLAVLGLVATSADAAGLWAQRVVTARGIDVFSDGDAAVMAIGSGARSGDALAVLLRCRCSRLDVVAVTGGGRTSSSIVYELRQVVDVKVVLSAEPGQIRDAQLLSAGRIVAGTVQLDVTHDDGWEVREVRLASAG